MNRLDSRKGSWVRAKIPKLAKPQTDDSDVTMDDVTMDDVTMDDVTMDSTVDINRPAFKFRSFSIAIVLLIFQWLSFPDILNLIRASSDLRRMIGSVPGYCNSIIESLYAVESNFFDSQIVNGYLVPSRLKFDAVEYIFHSHILNQLDVRYFFPWKRTKNLDDRFEPFPLYDEVLYHDQVKQLHELDSIQYYRFFEGTPFYLLFLSAFSNWLRKTLETSMRACKGRDLNVDPNSLCQILMESVMYDWVGLENTKVALLNQNSPGSKLEVEAIKLPLTVRTLLKQWNPDREKERAAREKQFAGPHWTDPE